MIHGQSFNTDLAAGDSLKVGFTARFPQGGSPPTVCAYLEGEANACGGSGSGSTGTGSTDTPNPGTGTVTPDPGSGSTDGTPSSGTGSGTTVAAGTGGPPSTSAPTGGSGGNKTVAIGQGGDYGGDGTGGQSCSGSRKFWSHNIYIDDKINVFINHRQLTIPLVFILSFRVCYVGRFVVKRFLICHAIMRQKIQLPD